MLQIATNCYSNRRRDSSGYSLYLSIALSRPMSRSVPFSGIPSAHSGMASATLIATGIRSGVGVIAQRQKEAGWIEWPFA